MRRAFALAPLFLLACVTSRSVGGVEPPTLRPASSSIHAPEYALPFHAATIVDLALIPPGPGERWRLVSGDIDGWVRFWADGRALAASIAHPGGLAALVVARDGTLYTAGFDGRVREWPAGATAPGRTLMLGRPVTALAVSDVHLGLSDGHYVQLWTRGEPPTLDWSVRAQAFVTGLTLSEGGGVIAATELRETAMRDAIATHPLATFDGVGLRAVSPEEAADLAYLAERDFPGAAADYVEVWQPSRERHRELVPNAPIDADIGIMPPGGVVYREIYGTDGAAAVGRRLEDRAHVSLSLVKPWALFDAEAPDPGPRSYLSVGDFVIGPGGEIIVVDHFPGWDAEPSSVGWRVGSRRELAIGHGYAALGDGLGNLAVVELAQPKDGGWLNPGEERPELLASAKGAPWIATATLEPRTQYRLWSLADGVHRAIRVEAPGAVVSAEEAERYGGSVAPMYPLDLALDDALTTVATSLSSFSEPQQAAVRLISATDGAAMIVTLATTAHPIEVALAPDAAALWAWTPGYPGFRWAGPGWTPVADPSPSGAPHVAANGHFAAFVSALERTIVDRRTEQPIATLEPETIVAEVGEPIPAAIANDGTLALVELFGGGTVELIGPDGAREAIELPGAATALAWIDDREARPVLLVGFEDGSIARIDREAKIAAPVHAGAGGRIWAVAAIGGHPGAYVELDDRGLALHRLDDDATIELYLGDATTLARHAGSPAQEPGTSDLVAIWRPGTAMPVCAIYDASRAGVLAPATIHRLGPGEGPSFFAAFLAGGPCPEQSPPAAIEPTPVEEPD